RERIEANHFVFVWFAAILASQLFELIEVKQGKPGFRDGTEISPAAFDGQNANRVAGKRIGKIEFGTSVSASKICNAQICSQQVGAVTQQRKLVSAHCNSFGVVPQIFQSNR